MIALLLGLILLLPDDLSQAEEAYRAGRYQAALELYTRALAEPGVPHGPILYNLGNCAFRLGQKVDALYHYRRALLRLPRDPELQFNLAFTARQLDIEVPRRPWTDWLTPSELLGLAFVLQTLGLAGIFVSDRRLVRTLMVLLVVLGLSCAWQLIRTQWFPGPPPGIALTEIQLRPEPHNELPATVGIEVGDTVTVLELSERWVRVSHPDGEGWTRREGVGVIN